MPPQKRKLKFKWERCPPIYSLSPHFEANVEKYFFILDK
jgi:hypothetical protein